MLPEIHLRTLRRKPRSAQHKLAEKIALLKQKSFKQIGEVFEKFIPRTLLKPEQDGAMSRRRIFSKENTFWAFFNQVLDADGGCKEVTRKFQSYASIKGVKVPSSSTVSYCVDQHASLTPFSTRERTLFPSTTATFFSKKYATRMLSRTFKK